MRTRSATRQNGSHNRLPNSSVALVGSKLNNTRNLVRYAQTHRRAFRILAPILFQRMYSMFVRPWRTVHFNRLPTKGSRTAVLRLANAGVGSSSIMSAARHINKTANVINKLRKSPNTGFYKANGSNTQYMLNRGTLYALRPNGGQVAVATNVKKKGRLGLTL